MRSILLLPLLTGPIYLWNRSIWKLFVLAEICALRRARGLKCMGGRYSFLGLLHFTLDTYLIVLSVKQGAIKYHFFKSLVWLDLGLNPGLPDHWRTLPTNIKEDNKWEKLITYFYFNWFLYKIIHRIAFDTFENKTIISEIINSKELFIKSGFVKTNVQIIHTIFYVNLYFFMTYV